MDWLSILCHELAHAKRHDHISGLFAELMTCILPWQPLLWWARHRLAALSEEACDDWVIASGQRATGYAHSLLGLIPQGQAALLPGVVTSRRGLAGRVRRILEDGCANPHPGVWWSLAAVVLAGSMAVGVAFAQTRPASPLPTEVKPSTTVPSGQLGKILDAMSYHDHAVLPIALHLESDQYNLDAPADSQRYATNVIDQRLDGKRFDSSMTVHVVRDGESQLGQVNRSVFNGEQYLYRQQAGVFLASLQSKDEANRTRALYSVAGSTLFGYLLGDEKPVAILLKNASDIVLYDHPEEVDGFACQVIEGKTDHGVYKLWVDPEHDYRIRRAIIDKGPGDWFYGRRVSTEAPEGWQDRTTASCHTEISGVKLEKIDGHFIATSESETMTMKWLSGRESHSKIIVKRSQINLRPDFEKLGAFVMDGIPEGTVVFNSDPNDHTYAYEWHNGQAVSVAPDGGVVAGRIRFSGSKDLSTILIGKRRFQAQFIPEGLGDRNSHTLTLTPERNGAFYVKDVPPGRYRLKLTLTDLVMVAVPNGGPAPGIRTSEGTVQFGPIVKGPTGSFMVNTRTIAETEREFSIPESKEAAQKTVDLGVIEMALPDTAESPGGADKHEGVDATPSEVGDRWRQESASATWRQRFEEVYRLADGEVLKRIAPPFIEERGEYYREAMGGRTMPSSFDQRRELIFFCDDRLTLWGESSAGFESLGSLLHSVLRLQGYEYEGPPWLLLDMRLPPGDWIVRDKASQEVKLRALEELVVRELGRKIRFEKRSVEQEVLVATGRFQLHPLTQMAATREAKFVHVYTLDAATEPHLGAGTARSVEEFLRILGDDTHIPVVDRTEPSESFDIPYVLYRSSRLQDIPDQQERARQLQVLLDHVTAQTELHFEARTEPVEVWFVTE